MCWSPFSHLPINSLRTRDLTTHLCSFKFVVMVSLEGKLNQSLDLELVKRCLCVELWDTLRGTEGKEESFPQSRQHLLAPTRYEGVWRKGSFLYLPASLLVCGRIYSCCLHGGFCLLLTSECSFFYIPCTSSGSLQTTITRLGLQRHLALWVEQGMKFSALPPSSQTIGLPRQNHGSQTNKSLLYTLFILLILYRNLIQSLGMVYASYVDWGDESNS